MDWKVPTITEDARCACGYNLRGLTYDHACPECGRDVLDSARLYLRMPSAVTREGRDDYVRLHQALADLQAQLATERAQKGRLEAELKQREELHSKLEERLTQLETAARERRNDPNAELVARLERAEAELTNRRPARK